MKPKRKTKKPICWAIAIGNKEDGWTIGTTLHETRIGAQRRCWALNLGVPVPIYVPAKTKRRKP